MGWTLYVHTNKVNGKKYVGITSRKVEQRWGYGGVGYKPDKGDNQNRRFWNAIKKYGWDNFDHEIIIENLSMEQAIEYEKMYILHYNSYKNGYNSTYGGDGAVGHKHSAKTKRQMSAKRKGVKHNPEWSKRIGEGQMIKRKVICLETGIIYDTPRHCADAMGLDFREILAVCKDDRNESAKVSRKLTVHGYHFQYADKPIKTIEEIESTRIIGARSRPVICLETNKEYKSAIECATLNHFGRSSIEKACNMHIPLFGKHYKYKDDSITYDEIMAIDSKRELKNKCQQKRIICLDDGKIFDTQKECGEHYGIPSSYINMVCRGTNKAAHGLHFAYYDDVA